MKLLLTFLACLTFCVSYSQKVAITYFDESWLLTTKELASYFRVGRIDTVKYLYHGEVNDYYISGKLQMKGKYNQGVKIDTFYFFYPNGNLMTQGYYLQNVRYGIWTNFYDNNFVKDKIVYNNHFLSVLEYYDKDGNQKIRSGNGEWETSYYNEFTMDTVKIKGYFVDSLRNGT
ncbi:hypothetical protein GXP67_11230 [Rhodocytophaga rosea]|uniref:Toxin-antitoxin system YwqK family antitoxin n=1 Tax=Rhodocytophaga rosea TaxID=2704465 RepID=A0A6C0GGP2_9BACT|nr:hypothetical protein [Rhodocytophaga rosea]QHT67176.1 hypothetical protein GXP67_11230 [Rhodocytophaga rosea]